MSDQRLNDPPEGPPVPKQSRRQWSWGTFWSCVGALATIASIFVAILLARGSSANDSETTPATPTTVTSTTSDSQPAISSDASIQVGTCLDGDLTAVPCAGTHRYEITGSGKCSSDEILSYLGGDAKLDALAPAVRSRTLELSSQEWCLTYDQGRDIQGSMRSVLSGEHAAAFRWCRNVATGTSDVACTDRHDQEVLAGPAPGRDCVAVAASYVGLSTVPDRLDVGQEVISGASHCTLSTIQPNKLNDTLRGRGTAELPIVS